MNLSCKNKIHHWHQHCTWLGHWSDDCFAQSNNPNPLLVHDPPIMTIPSKLWQKNGNSKDMINAFQMESADWSPTMALSFADTPNMCSNSEGQLEKTIACSLLGRGPRLACHPSKHHGVGLQALCLGCGLITW